MLIGPVPASVNAEDEETTVAEPTETPSESQSQEVSSSDSNEGTEKKYANLGEEFQDLKPEIVWLEPSWSSIEWTIMNFSKKKYNKKIKKLKRHFEVYYLTKKGKFKKDKKESGSLKVSSSDRFGWVGKQFSSYSLRSTAKNEGKYPAKSTVYCVRERFSGTYKGKKIYTKWSDKEYAPVYPLDRDDDDVWWNEIYYKKGWRKGYNKAMVFSWKPVTGVKKYVATIYAANKKTKKVEQYRFTVNKKGHKKTRFKFKVTNKMVNNAFTRKNTAGTVNVTFESVYERNGREMYSCRGTLCAPCVMSENYGDTGNLFEEGSDEYANFEAYCNVAANNADCSVDSLWSR
jgi:hypothetical protein